MRIASKAVIFFLYLWIWLICTSSHALAQSPPRASLRGIITDPSGASIPHAAVQLRGPSGERTQITDTNGQYAFTDLAPGKYDIQIAVPAFKTEQRQAFNVTGVTTLNVQLMLEGGSQVVTVQEDAGPAVSTDPDSNASAIVLGKTELDALSDDPDELTQQLQALAGPGVGTQGSQVYTDGFTTDGVPPKSSIRESRINANPYSAEYDQPGNGRVEILTKPGGETLHGQFSTQFNNQDFNTRSPLYLQSPSLPGRSNNRTNRLELSNLTIFNHRTHTLKWGARLRQSFKDDTSMNNFNGTFTFFGGDGPALDANYQPITGTSVQLTALDVYQRTLLLQQHGFSPDQVRAAGGGASLFSLNTGNPLTRVTQFDLGAFFNDDWKLRPNFTFSYGFRYEMQTNIPDARDWSPRLGIAWGIDGKGSTPAKTVLRAGGGRFYQRVFDFNILNVIRYNGVTQTSYLLTNPDFFPNIPSLSSLASGLQPQTVQLLSNTLQAPQLIFGNVGMDRQINKYVRLSVNYYKLHAVHFIRQRDINAPLPATNLFPFGDSTVRMMTESSGLAEQQQFVINPTINYKKVSFFGSYVLSSTKADFDGLAANPYNLRAEWAPAFGDIRHRLTLGPTFPLPLRPLKLLMLNTLFIYTSGPAYNLTTGLPDPSGDGAAVQRPALANLSPDACAGAALKYVPQFGCFDLLPAPGTPVIPRNFGRGPSSSNMTLRVSRTWDFVKKESSGGPNGITATPAGVPNAAPAAAIPMKYHLTFGVYAINPLNHPNFAPPNGNLTSPFFGKPLSLQGMFANGTFVPGNVTYNRKITMQVQLTF